MERNVRPDSQAIIGLREVPFSPLRRALVVRRILLETG